MRAELIDCLQEHKTPFFFYDMELLTETLDVLTTEAGKYGFHVHYAMKANINDPILSKIKAYGLGADCVSGNEVRKALDAGFDSSEVVFAGVGKTDDEINFALDNDILCFNCESPQEIEVLNELAEAKGKMAQIALRINPNVDALTHKYITTGLNENKFGINRSDLEQVVALIETLDNIKLVGMHFHIGSQITQLQSFKDLCNRVNEIQKFFISKGYVLPIINVGGGLGIDYEHPDKNAIPPFAEYFSLFNEFIELENGQELHFELGRSIVGQCGTLISRVLYIKEGVTTHFAILDAGMTELIRPALYQSFHRIENLTSSGEERKYDIVGPICESSDCFGKAVNLPETKRGDLISIRSAGAYGEVMSSRYNLRELPGQVYSNEVCETVG